MPPVNALVDELVLLYIEQFHENYASQPRFVWFHSHHAKAFRNADDSPQKEALALLDGPTLSHLQDVVKTRETFVFLLADHGSLFGEYGRSWLGTAEKDNPMAFLIAPTRWLSTSMVGTLKHNQEVLVGHIDVYKTLKCLMGT